MTILVGGTKAIDIGASGVDVLDLTAGTVGVATATAYRISHGSSFDEFTGTFTYDSAGVLIGGTITGWKRVTDGGVEFTATELALPVNLFLGYLANGDSAAFNDAVFGDDDKITGSAAHDRIAGSDGDDTMSGGGGNDTLHGGGGDDIVQGGAGNDDLYAEGGKDTLAGGTGNDYYVLTDVSDVVVESAGQGIDMIVVNFDYALKDNNVERLRLDTGAFKGTGNDLANDINGNTDANTLDGGLGNDTLNGGGGADLLLGGKGDDLYFIYGGGEVVTESADEGTDTIHTYLTTFSLNTPAWDNVENLTFTDSSAHVGQGNGGDNVITGGAGDDKLQGEGGNDTLNGGLGSDTLIGGTGADVMKAGGGDDFYEVDDAKDQIVEATGPSGGYDSVTSQIDYVLAANVEELVLGGSAISGTGNGGDNEIYGNAENNKLAGLSGDDYLEGGDGKDTLIGGGGNDFYDLADADDSIVESAGQGIDTIVTELIEFTLDTKALANVENLDLGGGPSKGTGNSLNNFIEGTGLNDTLNGGLGNDTLDGIGGDDQMTGDAGNDTFYVDATSDQVFEAVNGGIDTVRSSAVSYMLAVDVENLVLLSGALNGAGNQLANVITGNDEANDIAGFEGNDTLIGGKGNDALFGGKGVNVLIGGDGDDWYHIDDGSAGDKIVETAGKDSGTDRIYASISATLAANVEDLYLEGSAAISGTGNASDNYLGGNTGNNKLSGLSGNDSIGGDAGNDTIDGGAGNDSMSGDAGDDSLLGGAGNDQLYGATGNDTLAGGGGNDLYSLYLGADDTVVEAAGQGNDTIQTDVLDFTLDTVALANVENLRVVSSAASKGTGNALNNLIESGQGKDTLTGGDGNDTLDGSEGVDSLIGGKGNDSYVVDDIGDIVTEGLNEGTDTVFVKFAGTADMSVKFLNVENMVFTGAEAVGNALDNKIQGNDLINFITGGAGNDTLDGGANYDELGGGEGNDLLLGGDEGDLLAGGVGGDTMVGGNGGDEYIVDSAGDKVIELAGDHAGVDRVVATNITSYALSANVELLDLGAGAVNGTGNALSNGIEGNNLNNMLAGIGGNDTLDGGLGADTMAGGAGNDIYAVESLDDKVVEAAGQGIDTIDTNLKNYTLDTKALANVENLVMGGQSGGVGVGNSLNNYILSFNIGDDTLIGAAGNDTLDGFHGADSLIGGKGDDTYYINKSGDTIEEQAGEGKDTIVTSIDLSLAASAFVNIENVKIDDNAGAATVDGNALNNLVLGNTSANKISGAAGNDTLHGGSDNDTLDGEDGNDLLIGGDGNDSLDGGIGVDTMSGGLGDDIYVVDSASDKITELGNPGSGIDTVNASVDHVLSANLEQLFLEGSAVNGTGNAQNNFIFGNNNANRLSGLGGDDYFEGGFGNDTVDGGAGNDSITGGDDNDLLLGGAGNDTLSGDLGTDTMAGGAGNDFYYVLNSDDKITEAAGQGIDHVAVFDDISYSLSPNLENAAAWYGADITGNDLANLIDGSVNDSGDNLLSGLGGNDTLIGGAGQDTLTGDAGRDHFAFANIDAALDRVTDFDAGPQGDALDLSELLTGYIAGTSNASDFVKFVDSANDTMVQVDMDGAANGANFVDVCLLQGVSLSNVNQAVMEGNLVLVVPVD